MKPQSRNLLTIVVVVILGIIALSFFNMPDRRTAGERVDDAISEAPKGAGEAVEELQNRTPAERLGDAVEDAGDRIEDSMESE